MALYEDGKIKFDNNWINQFEDEALRAFLIFERYNLVDSVHSEYCTVEHWLYNETIRSILTRFRYFRYGWHKACPRKWANVTVQTSCVIFKLEQILKEIRLAMAKKNNWDIEYLEEDE